MNRAQKRIVKFSQRREMRHALDNFDPTRPLVYYEGYRHKPLFCIDHEQGGAAERPNNAGAGYYCSLCGHTVPSGECERVTN